MDRRTIVSLGLGLLSVACAAGAFESGPVARIVLVPLADAEGLGEVQGVIRDATTGEALKGALVIVQCSCLEGLREAETDGDGFYRIRDLPAGTYTIQVLVGQANVSRGFALGRGKRARADFRVNSEDGFIIT